MKKKLNSFYHQYHHTLLNPFIFYYMQNNIQNLSIKYQVNQATKSHQSQTSISIQSQIFNLQMIKKTPTFPPSKIKKIIQQNQEVGKLSNVVPYLVERSLELFLCDVLEKINEIADANDISKACPSILKKAIEEMPKYEFMKFAVDDLQEFQGLKKKKTEIKAEKVQRKKSSKSAEPEAPAEPLALAPSTKRGRKKSSTKEEKQEKVEQQVEDEVEQ